MADTDAIIDAAFAAPEAQQQVDAKEITNASKETIKESPAEMLDPADEAPDQPFPKKAINALSRRDKQIGKLKAQYEAVQAELEKYRPTPSQKAPQQGGELSPAKTGIPTKLNANSFANYSDFIEARAEEIADYKIEQKFTERESRHKETQQTEQEKAWVAERETVVAEKAQEFVKENPEISQLIDEYADVIDAWPQTHPHLTRAFLEADNTPLAFYNLAKEGKLEALESMSPARAAMEIGRAQTQAPTKPKTKAPTPLPASRGSVASSKSLESMSGDEIRKWMKSTD